MSKGEVIEHLGECQYRVKLQYAVDRVKAEIAELEDRLAEIAIHLPEAKLAVTEKESEIRQVQSYLDEWIALYETDPDEARQGLIDNQKALIRLQGDLLKLKFYADALTAESLSARKRANLLKSIPEEKELEAWCADYSDELSGLVGIVDINDEGRQGVVIQPGFEGAAEYLPARDGILMPRKAQSGAQVFFNAAILPGIQKWQPRYRLGTLLSIKNDTGTVVLDAANSSEQGLPINQRDVLSDIPIQYMDCNSDAFEIGDKVLVRWFESGPQVVGFEKRPRQCRLLRFAFEPSQYYEQSGVARRYYWGEPFSDPSGPINPPLGTLYGSDPVWSAKPARPEIEIKKSRSDLYGNRNWISKERKVLSWDGPPGRVFDNNTRFFNPEIEWPHPMWQSRWYTGPSVYYELKEILDVGAHSAAVGFGHVHGASVHEDGSGQRWLYVITSSVFFEAGQPYRALRVPVTPDMEIDGDLQAVEDFSPDPDMGHLTHWYFSKDGESAVCTFRNYSSSENNRRYYLARFSVSGGFSVEAIYDRDSSVIGTEQYTYTRQVESGTATRDSREYHGSYVSSSYLQPIYCEMIESEEVMVYHRIPGRQETNDYTMEVYENSDTGEHYVQSTQTINLITDEPEAIVSAKGDVIYELPNKESWTRYRWLKDDQAREEFTAELSESEVFGGLWSSYEIQAIDARFGFALLAHAFVDQNYSTPRTTLPYEDPQSDYPYASFPVTGSVERREVLVGVVGGKTAFEHVLEEFGPAPPSDFLYYRSSNQPSPDVDPTNSVVGTVSESSDIIAQIPSIVGNPAVLLSAGGFISRDSVFSAGAIKDDRGDRNSYAVASYLSDYENVISDVIDRSEADGYVLHRPGIF